MTKTVSPVTHSLRSLAKYSTARATSSGLPMRPHGVASPAAAISSSVIPYRGCAVSVIPGATALTAMWYGPSSQAIDLRQGDYSCLAGAVMAPARRRLEPGDRGDIDDAPGSTRDHHPRCFLGAEKCPFQIDVVDLIPCSFFQFENRRPGENSGVVDQDVERAKCFGELREHGADLRDITNVRFERDGRRPEALVIVRRSRIIRIIDRHRCSLLGKDLGDGPANALVSAGNEGRATREIEHVILRSPVVHS